MSSKKYLIIFMVFLLTLVALMGVSNALEENFGLYGTKEDAKYNNCQTYNDIFNLVNEGDTTSSYSISYGGSAKNFITMTPLSFVLKPGENQQIYSYMTFPCDKTGNYNLKINVKTLFRLEKTFEKKITLKKSPSFEVYAQNSAFEACSCTPVKFETKVKNTGREPRTYDAYIEGTHKKYSKISKNSFTLAPGDEINLFIFVTEPCYFYGKTNLELTIVEKETKYVAKVPLYLKTNKCYDYSVYANESMGVCNFENNVYPITINSQSDIGNVYSLKSKDLSLDVSSIFLWGHESVSLNASFFVPNAIEKMITFSVIGQRGNIEQKYGTMVVVNKCYSTNLYFDESYALAATCTDKSFLLILENDGSKKEKYNLSLEGPSWAQILFDKTLELEEGEKRELKLNLNIPCNASGKHKIKVHATIEDKLIEDFASFEIELITLNEAYKPKIRVDNQKVNYQENKISVEIENRGVLDASYVISVDAPKWITIDTNQKKISSKSTDYINLFTKPDENISEGNYKITVTINIKDTKNYYSKTFNINLYKETFWQKTKRIIPFVFENSLNFLKSYWLYVLLGVIIALLIIITLIFTSKRNEKRKFDERITIQRVGIVDVEKKKVRKGVAWKKVIKYFLIILGISFIGILLFLGYSNRESIFEFGSSVTTSIHGFGNNTKEKTQDVVGSITEFIIHEIPKTKSLIYVNVTGIRHTKDLIKIKAFEKTSIPVTIQNNDKKSIVYSIEVEKNTKWISTKKNKIEINPFSNRSFIVYILADRNVLDGVYDISIEAAVKEENTTQYTEGIFLEIEKETPFAEKYFWYILSGLIVLAFILSLVYRRNGVKRKEQINLKKENPLDLLAERKIKKEWFILVAYLFIAIIIFAGLISLVNKFPSNSEKEVVISGAGNYNVSLNSESSLNLDFRNNESEDLVYFIEHNLNFIEPKKKAFIVFSKENRTESLHLLENKIGEYKIKIYTTKKDKTKMFEAELKLNIEKRNLFPYYIILGMIVFLGFFVFLFNLMKNKKINFSKKGKEKDKKELKIPLLEKEEPKEIKTIKLIKKNSKRKGEKVKKIRNKPAKNKLAKKINKRTNKQTKKNK